MERILLYCDNQLLRDFALDYVALEIGRSRSCDVILHDPDVADRQFLVQRRGGAVVTYDLRQPAAPEQHLPYGQHLRVSQRYSIVRDRGDGQPGCELHPGVQTQTLARLREHLPALQLVVGDARDARRLRLPQRPVRIGSAGDNDLVLHDPTVSRYHCRIEPSACEVRVRDLGSRNGTFVNGVRILTAAVPPGAILRLGATNVRVADASEKYARDTELVAASPQMASVVGELQQYARLPWPALVLGPSGSGKEAAARALHFRGPRRAAAFVAVNAGGLPRDLVESELFGHERGAFTGAVAAHRGAFERASGGSLFLDEVGELPLAVQARLLRVLETWQVQRVGGESSVDVDVRLICATHRDLRALVAQGQFRQDLYYRIARLVVELPALRERPEDIEPLCVSILRNMRREVGPRQLSQDAVDRLCAYDWPGNIRELRNVLALAAVHCPEDVLRGADIAGAMQRLSGASSGTNSTAALQHVVLRHRGNIAAAARALGVPRSTLRDRLKSAAG